MVKTLFLFLRSYEEVFSFGEWPKSEFQTNAGAPYLSAYCAPDVGGSSLRPHQPLPNSDRLQNLSSAQPVNKSAKILIPFMK
jgi:hypothetical protein